MFVLKVYEFKVFSVCILFVREIIFVYITLKWFIGNIGREVQERFVTLKERNGWRLA